MGVPMHPPRPGHEFWSALLLYTAISIPRLLSCVYMMEGGPSVVHEVRLDLPPSEVFAGTLFGRYLDAACPLVNNLLWCGVQALRSWLWVHR